MLRADCAALAGSPASLSPLAAREPAGCPAPQVRAVPVRTSYYALSGEWAGAEYVRSAPVRASVRGTPSRVVRRWPASIARPRISVSIAHTGSGMDALG